MAYSPRCSDALPSSRSPESGTPRFTEHIHSSPPYNQHAPGFGVDNRSPNYQSMSDHGADTHHSSLLSKDQQMSPELINGGLEPVVSPPEEEKEVAFSSPVPDAYHGTYTGYDGRRPRRTICGISTLICGILTASVVIIALAIGLGVGLGIGLKRGTSSNSPSDQNNVDVQYEIGGAIDPKYFSTMGAFNGTGLALASQSFTANLEEGRYGSSVVYFQHWTGSLRWVRLTNTGAWVRGTTSEIVTSDAKNGTPISAVSHSLNGTSTWEIFYIDRNNKIRQRSQNNSTSSNLWTDGPINDLNLTAFDANQVGLQACWYGSDYGDSDYKHSPLPGPNNGTILPGEQGIWIWYAENESTFQQYGWRPGDSEWAHQETWSNKNGHAGVACYTWDPYNSTRYAVFVNQQNSVEVYWRDSNTNLTNTTTHPINVWSKASQVQINNVQPATSLGYTNVLYAQDVSTNLFYGYNISWNAENTAIVGDPLTVGSEPGIAGSHLTVSTLPTTSGGNQLVAFYQTNGTDISEFTRDQVAGQWTSSDIGIPSS